jgi:hypothetical protein
MGDRTRRRALVLGSILLVGMLSLCLAAGATAYPSAEYPGATLVAGDTLIHYLPSLVVRNTSTYRSNAPFPDVYNWYSKHFQLGPENHAQGTCILMGRSFTRLGLIKEQVTVSVCATPTGQMMFVDRSSVVRYWRW